MSVPRVTLQEIAEAAQTSVATVSKVLNGRPGVSDAQRSRILRLLSEHGYERRGVHKRNPARLIDVVVRGIDTHWATEVLMGAEGEAARVGAGIVVTVTHGRTLGNRRWLSALAQRHSDGLLLVASRLSQGIDVELAKLRIPYVLVDPIGAPSPAQNVPVIGASNFAGGLTATEHLLNLGHRRIGVISGDRDLRCSQERLDGYRAALGRAGLVPDDSLIRFGDFLTDGGYAAGADLLGLPHPPTAIFAGSDLQAYGVYRAAKELGLGIPEDLSVVGFDDVPLCQYVSPPLTTVRQPIEEMAREATRILLGLAYRGAQPQRPKLELATSLIVRSSTAPPQPGR
ncbi:MAG: substrate-binding domain-containing protein [Propionibacteriaceae bacterium]|jgi:LacI family transcriptional regulator|nr:substrate-binding domain-containing protein [Propionibacteriaceae bacterium]